MNSTADMLRQLRERTGLNQKDFAASVGMKQTTYNGYETGKHRPKSDVLIAIANKYNVSVDYLLGVSEGGKDQDQIQNEHYASLNDLYYTAVNTWIKRGFFTADEATIIRAHFSGVLSRYKELVEGTSRLKRTLKLYLKAIEPFNNERSSPLTTQELAEQFLKQELERVIDDLKHYIGLFTFHFAQTVADENLAGQMPSSKEGQESERWEIEEYRSRLLLERVESEQQKTPTPVSEDELEEMFMPYIQALNPDQQRMIRDQMQEMIRQQMIRDQTRDMIARQKEPSAVSVQQITDETAQ